MDLKYLLKIFIVTFLILSVIIFINSIGLNLSQPDIPKKLNQVVTIEALETLLMDGSQAFCESHKGFELETACNNLTKSNCNSTSCCIWTNDNKCKAGNSSGALFNSDSNGKTIPMEYYYYQNKCYGEKCPNQ